jgi:hypothetical protein
MSSIGQASNRQEESRDLGRADAIGTGRDEAMVGTDEDLSTYLLCDTLFVVESIE